MNAAAAPLTLGEAARRLGVELWMLQALLRRGLGPSLSRVGPYRVVSETDLAPLADALRQAGYLPRLTGKARPAIAASGDGRSVIPASRPATIAIFEIVLVL